MYFTYETCSVIVAISTKEEYFSHGLDLSVTGLGLLYQPHIYQTTMKMSLVKRLVGN